VQLPRVKELHKVPPFHFEPTDVNIDAIPYKDKRREKHRQEKLKQRALEAQQKKEEECVIGVKLFALGGKLTSFP